MCCQIPPCDDLRPRRTNAVGEKDLAMRVWATFAAGVVLLSLALVQIAVNTVKAP